MRIRYHATARAWFAGHRGRNIAAGLTLLVAALVAVAEPTTGGAERTGHRGHGAHALRRGPRTADR
jgi:hypothetical protein